MQLHPNQHLLIININQAGIRHEEVKTEKKNSIPTLVSGDCQSIVRKNIINFSDHRRSSLCMTCGRFSVSPEWITDNYLKILIGRWGGGDPHLVPISRRPTSLTGRRTHAKHLTWSIAFRHGGLLSGGRWRSPDLRSRAKLINNCGRDNLQEGGGEGRGAKLV